VQFILTGGGDYEHFKGTDKIFRESIKAGSKILILPYAGDEDSYDNVREHVESLLPGPLNVECEMLRRPEDVSLDLVKSCFGFYVEGGNTFDLITAVRQSNIETHLKQLAGSSCVFYADSAGAILLGRSVKTAFFGDDADDDAARLQDYRGLDLMDQWTVHAHYTPEDDEVVQNFVWEEGTPIIALHEESAISIQADKELSALGTSPSWIFTAAGKTKVGVGETVVLSDYF